MHCWQYQAEADMKPQQHADLLTAAEHHVFITGIPLLQSSLLICSHIPAHSPDQGSLVGRGLCSCCVCSRLAGSVWHQMDLRGSKACCRADLGA